MNSKLQPDTWLSYTDETNALDYLQWAARFIAETEENPEAWKWVILSLHGALYGFAIAACKGTDHESITRKARNGQRHLIALGEALRKCADRKWMGTLVGGEPLELSKSQKASIDLLKKTLRDKFEHYTPGIWKIEISGLPRMSIDVLDVIHFLALETIRYQHLDNTQRDRIDTIISDCRKTLESLRLRFEGPDPQSNSHLCILSGNESVSNTD